MVKPRMVGWGSRRDCEPLLEIEPDGHRAVIDDFNFHVRAKVTLLHRYAVTGKIGGEPVHQRAGHLGWGSIDERGPIAARGVGVQGELRNHQRLSADIQDRQVHFSMVILEYPQVGDLFGQRSRCFSGILRSDPQEDDIPPSDSRDLLPLDRHTAAADALNDPPHQGSPMAFRTSVMVSSARTVARLAPSCSTSQIWSGFWLSSLRRARNGSR